jgi:hypothetical protein
MIDSAAVLKPAVTLLTSLFVFHPKLSEVTGGTARHSETHNVVGA